jgi:hypothetical protein
MKRTGLGIATKKLRAVDFLFGKWLVLLLFLPLIAFAEGSSFPEGISFRRYLPKDGLPTAQIHRILQDHVGFIWFANIALQREGVRVLYISGYTTNEITHHGVLEEGMNFIQKSFSSQSLKEKIGQVLAGR